MKNNQTISLQGSWRIVTDTSAPLADFARYLRVLSIGNN